MSTTLAPPPPPTSTPPPLSSPSPVLVLADDSDVLGEGPVHDPRTGKLYRVDIEGKKVLSVDLKGAKKAGTEEGAAGEKTSSAVVGETPEPVGCLCLTSDPNLLLVALSRSVHSLDISTGKLSERALATLPEGEGVEGLRFNDGKASPRGTLVVGRLHSRWRDGLKGAVYALGKKKGPGSSPSSSEWELERVLGPEEVGMGNGMAWRPKSRGGGGGENPEAAFDFFVVDSAAKTVQRFATDPSTAAPVSGTGEVVLDASDLGGAVPDGMDVDADGMLWVALAETGTVACFDPDAKRKGLPLARRATLRLPLTRVTSCAFGARMRGGSEGEGEDFSSSLFVTSREEASKLKEEASPVAGAVLVVSDVAGAARISSGGKKVSAGCPLPAVVEL